MGYEVLDVGAPEAPVAPVAPVSGPRPSATPEVVDLEFLPEAASTQAPLLAPSRLLGRTAVRTRTALVLLVVLAAGAVGGATWASSEQRRERAAEREATLAVTALADSWTRVRWIERPVVDVVVRLVNTGPLAVEVVGTSYGDPPRRGGLFVRELGGGLRVAAGGELAVSVLKRIDCGSAVPLSLEIPVRTADGVVHQLPVRRGGPDRLIPRVVCEQTSEDLSVMAELTGSLQRPVIELRNPLPRPATILPDPAQPIGASRAITITTRPLLPLDLPSGAVRRVALEVRARACLRDSVDIQTAGHTNLVALSEVPGSGQGSSLDTLRQPIPLDLSAVVGAAVQRACE